MEKTYTNFVAENVEQAFQIADQVEKAYTVPISFTDNGIVKEATNKIGIYNATVGLLAETTAKNYRLVTHSECITGVAEALGRLNIPFTMNVVNPTNKLILDVKFKGHNIKFDKVGEEFATGVRILNSYDKSMGIMILPQYTRLACSNGMVMHKSMNVLSVKHTSKLVDEFANILDSKIRWMIANDAKLLGYVEECMAESIEWTLASKFLLKLIDTQKHAEEIMKRLGVSMVIVKDKNGKKDFSFIGLEEGKKLTKWEIYNAITHYISHDKALSPLVAEKLHRDAEQVFTKPIPIEIAQEVKV